MFDSTLGGAMGDRQRELMVVNNWVTNASSMREQLFDRLLDPRRDINKECGFPTGFVDSNYYWELYRRTAIATRVVQVMPKECWQVQPTVFETHDEDDVTPFEEAWDAMGAGLRGERSKFRSEKGSPVWEYLIRADILCGIGRYGVILLGLDDDMPLFMPVRGVEEEGSIPKDNPDAKEPVDKAKAAGTDQFYYDWAKRASATRPVPTTNSAGLQQWPRYRLRTRVGVANARPAVQEDDTAVDPEVAAEAPAFEPTVTLQYVRVFPEHLAQITQFESNPASPRFGQPVMYLITFNDPNSNSGGGTGMPMASLNVHWTRVVHVADNLTSNETFGTPRLEPVLDNVLGLRKMYAGAPEMYWKAAFMGLSLETNPQLGGDVNVDKEGLRTMVAEYHNGLTRALTLMGMTAKTLAPTVSDPTANIAVQLEIIAIVLSMPVRILKGSERGELASSQDDSSWNDELKARNDLFTTPRLIVPFVDRLVLVGVLPEPEEYFVEWPDLASQSEQDKATVCATRTTALQAYVAGNLASIVPPREYLIVFMGLNEDEVDAMLEAAEQAQADQLAEQQDAGLVDENGAPVPQETGQVDELGNPVQAAVDPKTPDYLKATAPSVNALVDDITAELEDEMRFNELAEAVSGWDDGFVLNYNPFHGHAGRFATALGTTVVSLKPPAGASAAYDVVDSKGGYAGSVTADDKGSWSARHVSEPSPTHGLLTKQFAVDHVHRSMGLDAPLAGGTRVRYGAGLEAIIGKLGDRPGHVEYTPLVGQPARHPVFLNAEQRTFLQELLAANENPNHDDKGRFAKAPGGGAPKTPAVVAPTGHAPAAPGQDDMSRPRSVLTQGGKAMEFAHKVVDPKAVDTMGAYKGKDGQWSKERVEKVHEPVLAKMLEGVPKAAGPVPTLYMTGGGWGSGKSTLLDKFPESVGFPAGGKAVRSDPDALKNHIPEYQKHARSGEDFSRGAPSFVHEESSEIAKTGVARGIAGGHDVVYDTSGDTGIDKLAGKIADFRAQGAGRVEAHYAFPGSVAEAQARADRRASGSGGLRRHVDPRDLANNHHWVAKTWIGAAERGTFDKITLWSTAGKFGDPPKLIATAEGGKTTVHDQGSYDAFRALAEEKRQ